MADATLRVEVGALFYRTVRKMVEKANFEGHPIQVFEGSGWLSREFIFKGSAADMRAVSEYFDRVRGEMEAANG